MRAAAAATALLLLLCLGSCTSWSEPVTMQGVVVGKLYVPPHARADVDGTLKTVPEAWVVLVAVENKILRVYVGLGDYLVFITGQNVAWTGSFSGDGHYRTHSIKIVQGENKDEERGPDA